MVGSVLHYVLGYKACELHYCTMGLCFQYHFIYSNSTGSQIKAIAFFQSFAESLFEVIVQICKHALSQVSLYHRSGHWIELYM